MSGKRANIFGQGRPESPYDERDEASDVPQRATAAQLAARKIKSAKPRRPAGSASVSSQGTGFGAPAGLNFGASAPAPSNGMNFGGSNAFGGGGGANNSFPPSQSSAPSNSFVSSSFPAFGASTQSTGFNPQPPSAAGFNFTAGNSNPFASTNGATPMSSAPASNSFGGGGIFSSQAPSNPFAGLSQGNTTSASSSGSLFGTISNTPSVNMFGTTNATSNASGASTPAPAPFSFGAPASSSQNAASTPATSGIFSGFGTSSQTSAAPTTNNIFGGFGAGAAKSDVTSETMKPGLFSSTTSGQNNSGATVTAPSSTGLFSFGANAQKLESSSSPAPSTNMFGTSNAATPSSNAASNPFGNLPKPSLNPAPAFSFGQQPAATISDQAASNPFSAIKLPETTSETAKPSLFSSVKTPQRANPAPTETPKANPFASLAKPPQAASTPAFGFGGSQDKEKEKDVTAPVKAPEAPKPNIFSGFRTPQPAKPAVAEKPAGLFSAQPKTSSGIFSQPETSGPSNTFKPQSTFAPAQPQSAQDSGKQTSTSGGNNPFAKLPAAPQTSMFAPKESISAPAPSPSPMPALTSGASTSTSSASVLELPPVPKAHVPKGWITGRAAAPRDDDGSVDLITGLIGELQTLNLRYREKLNSISPTADWSSLSQWHFQQSSALKKRIDNTKKQHASSKGITGHESSLSTKRKVSEEHQEDRSASSSKRARPAQSAPAPAVQPSTPTPKFNPPAPTATSNIFAKAINSQPVAASNPSSSKSAEAEAPKTSTTSTGFKPSGPATNGNSSSNSLFSGGFKPTTSTAISSTSSGGFKPAAASGSGGGFASQFASKAKTYEELAAERKKKAKDEDYDSDDETEEEWSARYDEEEAERLAKEKADAASISGFSLAASAKTSGDSTPAANPFASLTKAATGTSTPANGLFSNSRLDSPAPSTGSQSIFAASTAASPNIFGHISSGNSSNYQEDSDEDGEEPIGSVEATTPPKRKFGKSDAETEEDEASRPVKQGKGSLLSRMTRATDSGSESEKENKTASLFGHSNGTSTPTNKPFNFFDFSAAGSKTAPPKSSDTTFGGDQTFKPGTPIKFGEVSATEQKAPPTFSFQPASTSTTPSKPPPTSLFNFGSTSGGSSLLTPAGGLSGLNSAPSSVFSSRAATPLSEADTSAQSGADDEEEGGKQEQIDFGKLTEEELASNDVVFETDLALAKHHVDKGDGEKVWENFARGPLWILKDKKTGKCFVRIRIASGATPLNYNILPALKSSIIGSSSKMIQASMPKTGGGIAQVFISVKTADIAKEFSTKYNGSLP